MIKLVVFFALVASAIAAISPLPAFRQFPSRPVAYPTPTPVYRPVVPVVQPGRFIQILRFDNNIEADGTYNYGYDTENGISAQESGRLISAGPDAAIAVSGSYQYTSPEGVPVQISYNSGPEGFQPSGNVLPTPPPTPEAILRSLAYNAAHPEAQTPPPAYRQRYYRR